MSDFWKTDSGKIFNYVIHEHNSGLGYIANAKAQIDYLIKNNNINFADKESEKRFIHLLSLIIKGKEKCKEAVDYCYTKLKEKQNE
jgi:hypothetical protein